MKYLKYVLFSHIIFLVNCNELGSLDLLQQDKNLITELAEGSEEFNSADLGLINSEGFNNEFDLEELNKVTCKSHPKKINDAIISLVNYTRLNGYQCGEDLNFNAKPLTYSPKLYEAAIKHSWDMATVDFIAHTSSNGNTPSERIGYEGYSFSINGENVAAGQSSVLKVYIAWLKSKNHCQNLVEQAFTDIAVSCAFNNKSSYKTYWTMSLAAPK